MTVIAIDAIKVGERYRRDFGDIASLATSIKDVGLLQLPVVTADLTLVAGARRLEALRRLGRTEVRVHTIVNLDDAAALLRAERDENIQRKAMTPTEEHALYEALLALEKPKAEERKARPRQPRSAQYAGQRGEAKARAAEAVTGKPRARDRLDKVGEVKATAADDAKPEPVREAAREALAEMDATGRVDGAYQYVKRAEQIAEAPKPNEAIGDYLAEAQSVQDAKYMHAFAKAVSRADDFLTFDAERVGRLCSDADVTSVEQLLASTEKFLAQMRAARTGLRIVNGGMQ